MGRLISREVACFLGGLLFLIQQIKKIKYEPGQIEISIMHVQVLFISIAQKIDLGYSPVSKVNLFNIIIYKSLFWGPKDVVIIHKYKSGPKHYSKVTCIVN